MKMIPNAMKSHHTTRIGILLLLMALIAGMTGCVPGRLVLSVVSSDGGSVARPYGFSSSYERGTEVTLEAKADEGHRFVTWTGDVDTVADVNSRTTTIIMNGHYSITANFIALYDLTIGSTTGGSVTSPGEHTFTYDAGTVVSIIAQPEEGCRFLNWTSQPDGIIHDDSAAATTVSMLAHYSITALFAKEIRDWPALDAVRDDLGGTYLLMNSLDSTTAGYAELASGTANEGKAWQPIGTLDNPFTGTFDGRGHEISDLFISRPVEDSVGLFGALDQQGTVENLVLLSFNVTGYNYVGGLVGYSWGTVSSSHGSGTVAGDGAVAGLVGVNDGGIVRDLHFEGNVTGGRAIGGAVGANQGPVDGSYSSGIVTGDEYVGGLVGYNNAGGVSDSYSSSSVSGDQRVGGLVGQNSNGSISNSYSTGDVAGDISVGGLVGVNDEGAVRNSHSSSKVTGNEYVGGLVGRTTGLWPTISQSYSTGVVEGDRYVGGLAGDNPGAVDNSYSGGSVTGNERVGGLVGHNSGVIDNSYSSGSVTGSWFAGGLVGENYRGTVRNCFWDAEISGQSHSAGGTAKNTPEMQDIATFSAVGWDITGVGSPDMRNTTYIWNIVNGQTYPFLNWQPVS
jgi:hypothetical protein